MTMGGDSVTGGVPAQPRAASTHGKYGEAVREWAYCIAVDNELQGITMGRVFALADVLGIDSNQIMGDLRDAQAQIEEDSRV